VIFNQGTPTSGFLHDADFHWQQPWRRRLFAATTRFFYSRADAIVATSRGVADDLTANYGVPRAKIRILHNPVDLDAIVQQSSEPIAPEHAADAPVVAAAGRLAGVKNYPVLIAAIAELKHAVPVHAWILGEGPERGRLEALARERGVASLVRLLGFQQNPWRYIARADVFALTSSYEGFVATRSVGTAEIIEDGVNGLLVDASPAAVAAAIDRLLGDTALRERLIARARKDVEHYALPRVAARYQQLFEQVAA
jgi:glycosyltransferase involved in cell wall biosynthesis